MSVYFIRCNNYIKIGKSTDPWKRLAALQTGNPEQLEMLAIAPGGGEFESGLHSAFEGARQRGEWFEETDKLRSFIQSIRDVFPGLQEPPQIYLDKSQAKKAPKSRESELKALFDQMEVEVEEGIPTNFRLEQNSNGYYRLRYQLKDVDGNPLTYTTKSGRIGYKRGSAYVPTSIMNAAKRLME